MVRSKLVKLDSGYYTVPRHFRVFDTLKITLSAGFTHFSKKQYYDSIKALLSNIKAYITAQDANLLKIYSRDEVDFLLRDVRLLEQCLEEGESAGDKFVKMQGFYTRDKYMAENIEWILNHEGYTNSKMIDDLGKV